MRRHWPWRRSASGDGDRAATPAPDRPELFFVRGHPRSGTNWLGALLNLHPQVDCRGEFHFEEIRKAVDLLQSHAWHLSGREPVRSAMEAGLEELVRGCMEAQWRSRPERAGASRLGDRTPRRLRPLFRGARHVLIVRDGRDVLVSWAFHLLRQTPEVIASVLPAPIAEGMTLSASQFAADPSAFTRDPSRLLADEAFVRHAASGWAARAMDDLSTLRQMRDDPGLGRAHMVRYESLHRRTREEMNLIFAFLGLDPALAAEPTPEGKTTAGFDRHDPGSFYRHGAVGDWASFATPAAQRWFAAHAAGALEAMGYDMGGPAGTPAAGSGWT